MSTHAAVAVQGMDKETVEAVLEDHEKAPVSERLRAALRFLEKVTLQPDAVTTDDINRLNSQGLEKDAIRELLYVCFLFNVLDRLADSMDFDLPNEQGIQRIGNIAYRFGYGVAKLPG